MKLIDIHSHILPGIDDGAKDADMSVDMLFDAASQEVGTIVATPHFYGKTRGIEDFIKLRESSFGLVNKKAEEKQLKLPKILLGAEVALVRGISVRENLDLLCIADTNTILIELPFELWGQWVYNEVERIISDWQMKIVLAHPDRYIRFYWDIKKFKPFFKMGVTLQLNAESVLEDKRLTKKFLNSGCPFVLGSDVHNMQHRKSLIGAAAEQLAKQYGVDILKQINRNCDMLGIK